MEQVVEAQKKEVPSVFNPSIGLVGETIFSYDSRGSNQTGSVQRGGWDVFQRSMELNIASTVDPFAKAYAVLNASADAQTGEANLGVEEPLYRRLHYRGTLSLRRADFRGVRSVVVHS